MEKQFYKATQRIVITQSQNPDDRTIEWLIETGFTVFQNVRDFNEDLYPETACGEAAMCAEEWLNGENKQVSSRAISYWPKANAKLVLSLNLVHTRCLRVHQYQR